MKHFIRGLVLFVLALTLPGLSPSGESQPNPDADSESMKAMLKAAREVYRQTLESEKSGERPVDPERRHAWSMRILQSERDLAADKDAYTAAFKAHSERMVETERMARNFAKAGKGYAGGASAAEFFRVEAELLWAQAKKKK